MWLLYTSAPETRHEAETWNNCIDDMSAIASNQGTSPIDEWWWTFPSRVVALQGRNILQTANAGTTIRFYLKQVDEIPQGWE